MKIALMAGIDKPVTKESKGGSEVWAAHFALEATKRGHEIDLYALPGSAEGHGIQLRSYTDRPVTEYLSDPYFSENPSQFAKRKEQFMSTMYASLANSISERIDNYDIVIDSIMYPSFTFNSKLIGMQRLTVGHFPVGFMLKFYEHVFGWPDNNTIVFPSRYQYNEASFLSDDKKRVIPHGIDVSEFSFNRSGGNSMLWMGRVHHERMNKGLDDAIQVANATKRTLRATGIVERSSQEYFENAIKPTLSRYATFSEQHPEMPIDKNALFGNAKVLLLPLKWEEAFGLVMIESMATGTPVIAYARGAVPEIVADGETGFIVNPSPDDIRGSFEIKKTGPAGLSEAVQRMFAMSWGEYESMRNACRQRVETLYTRSTMFDHYEKLFETIVRR